MIIDCFQNQNLKNSEMSCLVTAVLEITECFHRGHGPGRGGGVEVAGLGGAGGGLRLDLRCVDHSQ